jgi:glutamyl-tRNA synthetase
MRTTHVVRGEEWLSTLPLHVQLFTVLGFKLPKYLHISLLMKLDGTSKRKLSKRHDPEAALSFYKEQGYPADSVREYVMTLLNSNFEEWRMQNKTASIDDFKFTTAKMSGSGSLFDINKLDDVSKNTISVMNAEQVYNSVCEWAKLFDTELYNLLIADPDYSKSIFAIGRDSAKPRKDLAKWNEVRDYVDLFFDDTFTVKEQITNPDAKEILTQFKQSFDANDDSSAWFEKIKAICDNLGYAVKPKDFKNNPDQYKGHVGDISMVIRIAVSGKSCSPDLYSIMQIIGTERVFERIDNAINNL